MKTRVNIKEILLWLSLLLVSLAAFFCNYHFPLSLPLKLILWIVWLLACFFILFFTKKGQHIWDFLKESHQELRKVVWPSRQETIQTTSIVMIVVAVTSLLLWAVDATMFWFIAKVTHLG